MGPFRYANIIVVVVQQDGANDINIIPLDFLYMLSHLYEGGTTPISLTSRTNCKKKIDIFIIFYYKWILFLNLFFY